MRLQAAVLPPREVQEDLAAVVQSVRGTDRQLEVVPAWLMHIPLAKLGKVSLGNARAVEEILAREVGRAKMMRLCFRSGAVLDPIGDDSAWALLDGEVPRLDDVATLITRSVKQLGFVVDRRLPRSRVRLGRITSATTESYLQNLVEELEQYAGPEWVCQDVALLRIDNSTEAGPAAEFEVVRRLTLSP